MSMSTVFEVEEESLAPVATRKPSKVKSPAMDNPGSDQDASEVATMMQEAANASAKAAFEMMITHGASIAEKHTKAAENDAKKLRAEIEALEERVKEAEKAKQKTVVVGIKINDLPPARTKGRPAKALPDILTQIKVGSAGGCWPFLSGPKGSGKTTAAAQAAEALGKRYACIPCSGGVGEQAFLGRWTFDGFVKAPFVDFYENGGLVLIDEVGGLDSSASLCLNAALANAEFVNTQTGKVVKRHADFICVAACNSNGKGTSATYTGRDRQDAAFLDRFSVLTVDYDTELERELCPDKKLLEKLWSLRVKLSDKKAGDSIGTRKIKNSYLQVQAGFSVAKVFELLANEMDSANKALCLEIGAQ